MIRVSFDRGENEALFRINGHAGHAEPGKPDIVCAAASMLAFTLIGMTERIFGEGKACSESRPGSVEVRFPPDGDDGRAALAAAEVVEEGFRLLAEAYPECVCFAESETYAQ
ncbi:MAG: ribosomal-processing cysteine protease Prp [Clostridia bacterium]|nr:ribosomal-processing cysteine protease Prp [Clostridia bacterium]